MPWKVQVFVRPETEKLKVRTLEKHGVFQRSKPFKSDCCRNHPWIVYQVPNVGTGLLRLKSKDGGYFLVLLGVR